MQDKEEQETPSPPEVFGDLESHVIAAMLASGWGGKRRKRGKRPSNIPIQVRRADRPEVKAKRRKIAKKTRDDRRRIERKSAKAARARKAKNARRR